MSKQRDNKNIDRLHQKAKHTKKDNLMTQIPKHYLSMLHSITQIGLMFLNWPPINIFGKGVVTKACIFLKLCFEGSFISGVSYCIAKF